jgi:omptin
MFMPGGKTVKRLQRFIIMTLASVSFAATADNTDSLYTSERLTLGINMGVLSGQAKERVYFPEEGGRKASQLNWEYSNAAVIKGSLDWDVLPWVSVGASGWTTITSKDGHMEDYDWMDARQSQWSDRSVHPDTTLQYANEFDLHLTGWLINQPAYRFGLMAGYQESRLSFRARGGSYDYNNGADIGEIPAGVVVIDYKQRFKTPYVGLVGSYRYQRFDMEGALKYSRWVSATDFDEHYLADKNFVGKTKRQHYYSLVGNLGYFVTDNTKLFVEGAWSRMRNKKGSVDLSSRSDDYRETFADSAGIENSNVMMTLGLKHMF